MKTGLSTNIGAGGQAGGGTGTKTGTKEIPRNKQLAQQAVRTSADLSKTIDNSKEPIAEEDSELEDDLEKQNEEITDEITSEEGEESTEGPDDEGNDDDVSYDEPKSGDPFDVEDKGPGRRERYVVEVSIKDNTPVINFLHIPKFKTKDPLIEGAIYSRYKLFHEMATFIGKKQLRYIQGRDDNKKVNLNQTDLVDYFNAKGLKGIKDEHIARMLDALFFQIDGCTYPARYLFKRHGKFQLNEKDKATLGKEFINSFKRKTSLTKVDVAKKFHEFIKNKRGIELELTDNPNEYQKYRSLIDIIKNAERLQKKPSR